MSKQIKRILISPLFGGENPGVINNSGLIEADYNLNQGLDLYRYLGAKAMGYDVTCTRHANVAVPWQNIDSWVDLVILVCSSDHYGQFRSSLLVFPESALSLAQVLRWNLEVATREIVNWTLMGMPTTFTNQYLTDTVEECLDSGKPTIILSPVKASEAKKNNPLLTEVGMRLVSIAIGFGLYQYNKGVGE